MERAALLGFARALARAHAGLNLPQEHGAVEMRLAPLARREGMASAWALLSALRQRPDSPLALEAAEALAPRDTWFFRDREAFRHLAETTLPDLAAAIPAGERLRVWCAGCGAGQEAWSVAMLMRERRGQGGGGDAAILATDVSRAALRRTQDGLYDQFEAQRGLSIRRLLAHFVKDGEGWRIGPDLRPMVETRAQNLVRDEAPAECFDLVLLRHVLPHVAADRRADVLRRVTARIRPGGWLMLGAKETLGEEWGLRPAPGEPGLFRVEAGAYQVASPARAAA